MAFSFPTSSPSFPEELWTTALDQLSQQIRQYFIRPESHQRALAYMQGLTLDVSRKTAWQVAEAMGEATPYAIQHLLDRARWDCDGMRDALRAYVQETLASPHAVLVIDETGFLKKGGKSVGVQRQYSGTAGRIENCQIGVFRGCRQLAWTHVGGSRVVSAQKLDREPGALPRSACPGRSHLCDEAGTGMAHAGTNPGYRPAGRLGRRGYGLRKLSGIARPSGGAPTALCSGGDPASEQVEVQGVRKRVDQLAHDLPGKGWQELSAGAGSKGPRLFAWARIELAAPEASGWQRWLLIRRSLEEGADPAEMAYVLVFAPTSTSLEEMVEAFGARWTVEQCFEEAKGEVGLDEYEVRSWHGWYRHITLSMLSLSFLTALRACGEETILKKSLSCWARLQNQKHPDPTTSTCLLIFQ